MTTDTDRKGDADTDAPRKGYKFLTKDMRSSKNLDCVWKVGKWKSWEGPLVMCESGFHFSKTPFESIDYADYGESFCVVEWEEEGDTEGSKTVCRRMRVVKVMDRNIVCRKFAIACARHVLPIFEKKHANDKRPREAIEAAEAYLHDPSEANRAKMDAARDAAWAAAWAAARDAAWAAARDAAWAAARAAAWAAARAAARDAERKWQNKTLLSIIEDSP